MKTSLSLPLVALAFAPLASFGQPGDVFFWDSELGGNDHCYQLVTYDPGFNLNRDGSWEKARAAAASAPGTDECEGKTGYLVTITTAQEQGFVADVVLDGEEGNQYWIGGVQTEVKGNEPAGNWNWISTSGQGVGAAIPTGGAGFNGWLPNQPDNGGQKNSKGNKAENNMVMAIGAVDGWDDASSGMGYVIEWGSGAVVDEDCVGAGCPIGAGAVYRLPDDYVLGNNVVQDWEEIAFSYDPRVLAGTCGTPFGITDPAVAAALDPDGLVQPDGTLRLLYEDADGDGNDDDDLYAIVPPVYCAFNEFILYVSDGQFEFIGTAEFTSEALADGFVCDVPLTLEGTDPQMQPLVLYSSDLPGGMPEFGNTYQMLPGNNAVFKGAATDVSNECGSSRGRVVDGTIIYAGFSFYSDYAYLEDRDAYDAVPYDLPAIFDPPDNPFSNSDLVLQALGDLAAYKFLMLQVVIDDAEDNFATNGIYQNAASQTLNSYGQYLSGNFQTSIDVLNINVNNDIVPGSFVDPSEDYGPILMRLSSLIFHLEKLKSILAP